jgi:predicted LPLAT superfamily acyltransferase
VTSGEARPWHALTERGTTWGLRLTVGLFRLFGRRPTAVLVHLIVAYFWLTDAPRRRASLVYLRRIAATPEGLASLGGAPGWRTTYRHFQAFGTSLLDRFSLLSSRAIAGRPTFHGRDHLDRLIEQGRGAILLGSHLGSLESFRLFAEAHSIPIHAVMHTPATDRFRAAVRRVAPETDRNVIQVERGSIQSTFDIRAAVERGEVVAILGDRVAVGQRQPTSEVEFLGGTVRMPHGPLVLAGLIDCPVLLAFGLREAGGAYHMYLEPFTEHVDLTRSTRKQVIQALLQEYTDRVEHHCRRAPLQWFNFHNVWREGGRAVE